MANIYAVEFPGALRAAVIMNQVIQTKSGGWTCRMDGTLGTIKISNVAANLELYSKKLGDVPYTFTWDPYESMVGINGVIGGHGADMVDLVNAISEDRAPGSSGRDNLNTVGAYLAAKRSSEERRPVSPEEIK